MSKIAFVTDSTAYIPPSYCAELGITVVPQVLIWGEETFRDGVDIRPDEFYARLRNAKIMPSTSQVSIPTMQNTFQSLVDQGLDVVGIFISAKLSGTMQSAIQGREALGSASTKVTLIDSDSVAMAMGFQVLTAARAARDGASLAECVSLAERARSHTGVYFAVDTLEFLHRGGRIGGATRFVGTALNLKPVLQLKEGHVEPIARIRTKSKALDHILELVDQQTRGKSPIRLATLHAHAPQEAQGLLERASQKLGAAESILSEVSPVVGTHAGPGTVGLAYMAGM
jgi:DegV family protein with EDD domain